MVDRAAGADHVRLGILRMDARFHVEKRVATVTAKPEGRK
jgi:hypothetical protein